MPLNSIQQYVYGLLNGISVPAITGTMVTWVQPPVLENLNINGLRCYVWGESTDAGRQTMPRGQGFMKQDWPVSVWLVYETSANQDNLSLSQQFPCAVDAVAAKLNGTVMPIIISDPTTMQESQIQAVGEKWHLSYPPVRSPASMQMLWFAAKFNSSILEVWQG